MKKLIAISLFITCCLSFSFKANASLEIFCPKDKEISYSTYSAGKYYDKPVVWGAHTLYGPWIKTNLNCNSGYVDVKWEIVDHYARSYYCTQTIWVTGGSSSPISVWCPKESILYCDEVDSYKFPKPEVTGYNYTISGPWLSKKLNECGVGSIWVEWKITDGCSKSTYCKTVYWVKERYGKISVWWPKDFDADACKDQTDPKFLSYPYGYPEISSYNKCGKYGINYKDEIFTFPNDPGICRKIVRTWTIIDWCTYNPNSYGYGYHQEGIWRHVQLIKVISKSKPTISCVNEVRNSSENYSKTAWIDIPIPSITNSCNGQAYITHNSPYATKPNSADASGNYPIGITEVVFSVTDACGNFSRCTTKVKVEDKAPPTPYCIGTLVAGIGWHNDGIYTIIDPKKFDVGSYDNCTPKDRLKFSAFPSRLNCDSLGTRNIQIWVEDEAGNKNFCRVKIILQDNQGMCPKKISADTIAIAGLIQKPNNKNLDSVSVQLSVENEHKKQMGNGKFKFEALTKGKNYKVSPVKTGNFLEGITLEDYDMLVNFVQGQDTFNNPLQYLAADITENDTIDYEDVLTLGNYLISQGSVIPVEQHSWRFAPKSFNLKNIKIKDFVITHVPNFKQYTKLDSTRLDADFIGVKLGDINFSLLDTVSKDTIKLVERIGLEERGNKLSFNTYSIRVFPNPFSEKLVFIYTADQKNKEVELSFFTISGQKVYEQKSLCIKGINQTEITADKLSGQGLYFYKLKIGTELSSGKVALQY